MTNLVEYTDGKHRVHACKMHVWNVPDHVPVASDLAEDGYLVVYGLRTDQQTQVWINEDCFNKAYRGLDE